MIAFQQLTTAGAHLQLFALAFNLGNFLRRLALPKPVRHWSLTTLTRRGARYYNRGDYGKCRPIDLSDFVACMGCAWNRSRLAINLIGIETDGWVGLELRIDPSHPIDSLGRGSGGLAALRSSWFGYFGPSAAVISVST